MKQVIIVGGGIGGICSAIRLLNEGYKVTILEKNDKVGGKVNQLKYEDYKFDLTASILMTPDIYTDIFNEVGKDYREYIQIDRLEDNYKVFYHDKSQYTFYSDLNKMAKSLEDIQEGLSIEYLEFLFKSLNKYLISKDNFLDKDMLRIRELINIDSIKNLINIKPLCTSSQFISKVISNQKLREYLIFQSMYIGTNPYKSSSLYTLIPAISHVYGLYYIQGGMYEYIKALEKLVLELGGKIVTNTYVEKIIVKDKKIRGIRVDNKDYISDIVICNSDYPYSITNLLEENNSKGLYNVNNIDNKYYSCSVFMLYLGLNKKYNNLSVHNIYINEDFKENIQACFKGMIPDNPSLYIYYPSKVDNTMAGNQKSVMNIMVRVPNLDSDVDWNEKCISSLRNKIINILKEIEGLEDIEENIDYENIITPNTFKYKFNSHKGTAFGLSHNLCQTTYFRPKMKSKSVKGLYFIGASTHPGNGISVVIDGTKVLKDIIINEK